MRSPDLLDPGARQRWAGAAGIALGGHALALGAVLLWSRDAAPPPPEPVVLVELPEGASAPAASQAEAEAAATPETTPQPPQPTQAQPVRPEPLPPLQTADPLPSEPRPMPRPVPVALAQSAPLAAPQRAVSVPAPAPPAPAPASRSSGSGTKGDGPGTSAKARKAQADYFAMIAAHLQRKKSYPKEAKKARQQGTVTVRFTVARDGSVSAVSIKTSSGHDLLDGATLDLLRRVAPLPRMPSSMERDSVTLALPIDYSLRTD
ncbi:TonB family protein [Novosphingobium mangrovi (ex Hu et al. 2023)]|uniref:TonB family protein n=1 Tax=Novosphingobium mangrovi (ex Hu et al. 2023) TaxID=2930094 RepID=A0ABT0AFB5_9SPHN|nr:TonB family protein [Novosphingobium mangrovi (ex Hu et al. 2023)]MCJ1961849.1 TonB family protein [Novosphingobium mangrovi (ex Hu et al. 2023)]